MSWGTTFTYKHFLDRQTFENRYQLEEAIRDKQEEVDAGVQKIMILAASNPGDLIPGEWKEDPVSWLHMTVSQLLNDYTEDVLMLRELENYLEVYEEQKTQNDE
jgi:hypothetical protein